MVSIEPMADYPDTGCRYFDACLSCPLPECLEDHPLALSEYRTRLRRARERELLNEMHRDGLSIEQAAWRFDVTPRTIYRMLQRARESR